MRVAGDGDLGVRTRLQGLLGELGHDRSTAGTHLSVRGDGGLVVHTLNGDARGTELSDERLGESRAD